MTSRELSESVVAAFAAASLNRAVGNDFSTSEARSQESIGVLYEIVFQLATISDALATMNKMRQVGYPWPVLRCTDCGESVLLDCPHRCKKSAGKRRGKK